MKTPLRPIAILIGVLSMTSQVAAKPVLLDDDIKCRTLAEAIRGAGFAR